MVNSDNGLSVKSKGQVKLKPAAFSALPDSSDTQLKIAMDDIQAKAAEQQALQEAAFGARQRHLLERLIRVPIPAGYKGTKIPGQYYLWAALDGYQGDDGICHPAVLTLALNCRKSDRQIQRWMRKLEDAKVVVTHGWGKNRHYHVKSSRNITPFVFVDPRWVHQLGLSINEAVLFGYGDFKLNHKPESWFPIRRAAWDLGLSYNTIRRCRAVLAAWDFTEIKPGCLRGGRTNRCQLTSFGWMVSWENYPKQARPKCHPKRNTIHRGCYSSAHSVRRGVFFPQFGLSNGNQADAEVFGLLRLFKIHWKVAKPAAFQWQDEPESVENMFWNWVGKTEQDRKDCQSKGLPARKIPLAGYVMGGLNIGIAEHHPIKLSSAGREAKAKAQGKLGLISAGPPPEAELKKLEQYAENVLKPDLEKLHPPGESAIPA
jgi:hypothetical protein